MSGSGTANYLQVGADGLISSAAVTAVQLSGGGNTVMNAGTISGRVEMTEKGGRKATDLSDVVVYVEGARPRPRAAATASPAIVMKGKAFNPRVVVVPVTRPVAVGS